MRWLQSGMGMGMEAESRGRGSERGSYRVVGYDVFFTSGLGVCIPRRRDWSSYLAMAWLTLARVVHSDVLLYVVYVCNGSVLYGEVYGVCC